MVPTTRKGKSEVRIKAPSIAGSRAYVDRIDILIPRHVKLRGKTKVAITGRCPKAQIRRLKSPAGVRWKRLVLPQPDQVVLRYVAMICNGNYRITYLEVALDLFPSAPETPQSIEEFFQRHLVKPWHGQHKMSVYKSTTYWALTRRARVSLAMYADRSTKLVSGFAPNTMISCCHLEVRMNGTRVLRELNLSSVQEINNLDMRIFWQRRLRIAAIDPAALYRAWAGLKRRRSFSRPMWRVGKKKGPQVDHDVSKGQRIMRVAWAHVPMVSRRLPLGAVQPTIDLAHRFGKNIRRALRPISNTSLLPPASVRRSRIGP